MIRLTSFVLLLLVAIGCSSDPAPEPAAETRPAEPSEPTSAAAPSTDSSDQQPFALTTRRIAPPKPSPIDDAELELIHEYTELFYDGELATLWEEFSDEMKKTMTLTQLAQFRDNVRHAYGEEKELIAEESDRNDEYRAFVRWAYFEKTDDVIEVQWILRPDDSIAGLLVRPAERKTDG